MIRPFLSISLICRLHFVRVYIFFLPCLIFSSSLFLKTYSLILCLRVVVWFVYAGLLLRVLTGVCAEADSELGADGLGRNVARAGGTTRQPKRKRPLAENSGWEKEGSIFFFFNEGYCRWGAIDGTVKVKRGGLCQEKTNPLQHGVPTNARWCNL